MFTRNVSMIVAFAMLSGIAGCQSVSFADGYKGNNCGMTGATCGHQSRSGTKAMNAR